MKDQEPENATNRAESNDLLTEILKDKGWRVLSFKHYVVANNGKVAASWPHHGYTGDLLIYFVCDRHGNDGPLMTANMGAGHGPLALILLSY